MNQKFKNYKNSMNNNLKIYNKKKINYRINKFKHLWDNNKKFNRIYNKSMIKNNNL